MPLRLFHLTPVLALVFALAPVALLRLGCRRKRGRSLVAHQAGGPFDASAAAPPAIVRALVEALEAANQFITNGIELGFIRMPDASTPDPAHKTPDRIRAAIAAAKEAGL